MRGDKAKVVNYPDSLFITVKPKKYEMNFRAGEDAEGKAIWKSVPLKGFRFVFLDQYQRIFGEHKQREVDVKSTLVREKQHPFIVKTRKGGQLLMQGTWEQIKEKALDNKLCKGFDVLALSERGVLITLRMNSWASAIAWSEFYWDNANDIQGEFMVEFNEGEYTEGKRGSWYKPKFKLVPITKELAAQADKVIEEQVKPFVKDYFEGLELQKEGVAVEQSPSHSVADQPLVDSVNDFPLADEEVALEQEDDLPF